MEVALRHPSHRRSSQCEQFPLFLQPAVWDRSSGDTRIFSQWRTDGISIEAQLWFGFICSVCRWVEQVYWGTRGGRKTSISLPRKQIALSFFIHQIKGFNQSLQGSQRQFDYTNTQSSPQSCSSGVTSTKLVPIQPALHQTRKASALSPFQWSFSKCGIK